MEPNCMRILLWTSAICGLMWVCYASPKRDQYEAGIGGGKGDEYLSMHMKNNTSCFTAIKSCRKNKKCSRAMKELHKTCTEKNGQCNANLNDLVKCADIMDVLLNEGFPTEKCSCRKLRTKSLMKCFDIHNKIYANPCFDEGKKLRDALMTTTPSSIVNDVTDMTSQDTIHHQFDIGTVDALSKDVEEASIRHLRVKGMFPTPTPDPKKELIVPDATAVSNVNIENKINRDIGLTQVVNTHQNKAGNTDDDYDDDDTIIISEEEKEEDHDYFKEEEILKILDEGFEGYDEDDNNDEEILYFIDGIDLDSDIGIDKDFFIENDVRVNKAKNKSQRKHPVIDATDPPTMLEVNSPKVEFSNYKTSRGVNRPIEVKSSLLYFEAASQNTPLDVSVSNSDHSDVMDIKIIAIICATLLAMFITAAIVFVAYLRTHGKQSYVSGKKVKTKNSTPNKREIVGNLA